MANANAQPRKRTFQAIIAATAQAATAVYALFVAPFDGTIESVTYAPVADITGADTHTRKTSIINKGAAGDGTTEVAALQFNDTINATDFTETAITLSGTAASLDAAAGDVIAWSSAKVGNGIADPGGLVTVVYKTR